MTPQQIIAMKQALEALELINIEFVCGNGSHHKKEDRHEWDEDCPITNRWRKAITALEEALAQPEQEPVIDKSAAKRIATALGWTPQRKPLTNGEIYTAYITATNQMLRAQDERLAFAFARAIEAAHGIKENT
jgi:hypothetical protein